MMKAFRITEWDDGHETHESKKLQFLNWVAIPNKHDGLGFSHLRGSEDRVELYCAWTLMVQLASKARKGMRGWLVRGKQPLTTHDMAMMTGFPEEIFKKAIQFFQRPEIGWLVSGEPPFKTADAAGVPPCCAEVPADAAGVPPCCAEVLPTGRQTGMGDRQTDSEEEKKRGGLSGEQLRKRQTQQFAAAQARLKTLEAIPEDDRTEKNRAELKDMKGLVRKIQKKQARNDFTPVEEEAK